MFSVAHSGFTLPRLWECPVGAACIDNLPAVLRTSLAIDFRYLILLVILENVKWFDNLKHKHAQFGCGICLNAAFRRQQPLNLAIACVDLLNSTWSFSEGHSPAPRMKRLSGSQIACHAS